jgi:hypothetical protein
VTHAPVGRPPERYGDLRPGWHRTLARVLTGVLAVVALAAVAWAGLVAAGRDVRWQDVGFRLDAGAEGGTGDPTSAVEVTFEVTVYEGTSATCTVRALSSGYAVVGRVEVPVEVSDDERTVRRTATVQVSEPAASAEVERCTVP